MSSCRPSATGVGLAFILATMLVSLPSNAKPKIGKVAPNFSLRDREGTLVRLSDFAYRGKDRPRKPRQLVVLDFFRTDCKPCKKGLPKLVKLHQSYK